ncbi:GGDEF domain-containing protein [Hydrocarboniclastica marina]|uniref:diguanylate cyclase n=1 Tax=Hydrocarboniclastica marina TaxID=2259620 RepID=A0A4P7XFK0_9ALTE|nr:diguanylate cyclase [Hydrocarboniclastica marina]QCF25214.1 diguanylate cyclase [Hydrocarboniclastica marina]
MLAKLDRIFTRLTDREVFLLAVLGVLILGVIDAAGSSEVSIAVFYIGPVAMAAWYSSRRKGIVIALLACLIWYLADIISGAPRSHPAIPVWNALVRLGFFLTNALLISKVRSFLTAEQQLARTDPLTATLNLRAFREQLQYSLALARRHKGHLTLAYIDLDDFKKINDQLGHDEGDRILAAVAAALRNTSRASDTVARLGGDEFALLMPGTDLEGARKVLRPLKRALLEINRSDNQRVTCSVGAVTFLHVPASAEIAVRAADQLMYAIKRQSKDDIAVALFDPRTATATQIGTERHVTADPVVD